MDQIEKPNIENGQQPDSGRLFELLIVDDDQGLRQFLDITLRNERYKLLFCEDGKSAIRSCEGRLPDLAILDIQMPGMNGLELCKWLKSFAAETFIPIMILTADLELNTKVRGLDCGADDFMTKPFSVAELEARIRALLRIKVLTDELRETRNLLAEKERELLVMEVAGAAAHELGQPLTSLLLLSDLLQKQLGQNEETRSTLTSILEQCQSMRKILSHLEDVDEYKTKEYPGNVRILDINRS